ncbi:FTR1 family iron permease [Brevibacillus marinus]|uniref:FTR1 family iron permease n=1 Tax=Brevibacillus marinus TaxID=2496837 RepID=UPI000F82FEF5|nr:FTR1 family protein [Brevibacillus marinus]
MEKCWKVLLLLLLLSLPHCPAAAEEASYGPLFISIGDAIMKTKAGDWAGTEAAFGQFKQQWEQLAKTAGPEEQAVNEALAEAEKALAARDSSAMAEKLSQLSAAFFAYDKMMHPVDEAALREEFRSVLAPALRSLEEAVAAKDEAAALAAYKKVLAAWNKKEMIVREQSLDYYGQIETKMGFLRIALSKESKDFGEIERYSSQLSQAVFDFAAGKEAASAAGGNYSLQTLVDLLDKAVAEIERGQPQLAVAALEEFLTVWPAVEGEVSTRSASLYNQLENNIPLIAGKLASADPDLEALRNQLKGYGQEIGLLQKKSYTTWDVALVMLREGLEALLIVSALIAYLKRTGNHRYQKWIWLGAAAGVVVSVVAALVINAIFTSAMAGTNREIIEGVTGIIAVLMMIGVGIWLHQKSYLHAWNRYISAQMSTALSIGSVLGMAAISFLSIFREGAETIIFYIGMAPSISAGQLLAGIGLAALLLLVFTVLLIRFSMKIPVAPFFKAATLLIYVLAFKILGVSLHALQLTNVISVSQIANLPIIDLIGFFPTWETVLPQLALLAVVALAMIAVESRNRKQANVS